MRILHITYIYPPRLGVADGITAVANNVTKELAKRGHETWVFTSDMANLHGNKSLPSGYLRVNGVNVYYSKSVCRFRTFIITPGILQLLSNKLKVYNVMHIHDCRSFQGISAFIFAKITKTPYIFQPHGSYLPSSLHSPNSLKILKAAIDKIVCNRIVRGASQLIVLSEKEADQYRRFGLSDSNISVVANGIDLSKYLNLPKKGCFKRILSIEKKKIILYVGRIHRTKGIDFLLRAYSFLVKNSKFDNTVLVIAGPDDGYLKSLRDISRELNISEKVIFTGLLSERDKLAAYVDAEVVVNVEPNNVFGLVPLEAAACSRPVIVTTGNCISEVVNTGMFGYAIKYGDVQALIGAISEMVENHFLSKRMGDEGRRYVFKHFGWTSIAEKVEKLYEKVAIAK